MLEQPPPPILKKLKIITLPKPLIYKKGILFKLIFINHFSKLIKFPSKKSNFPARKAISQQERQFPSKKGNFPTRKAISQQERQFPSKKGNFPARKAISQQERQFPSKKGNFPARKAISQEERHY